MTSGGNSFNYFPENQLIKLSAVSLFTAAFAVLPSFCDNHSGDLFPLFLPFPSLRLEGNPEIQLEDLGSAVSSASGVWGGAPAEIKSGAF